LQQIGVIHESAMLTGQLKSGDIQRLPPGEEAIVLRVMHQTLADGKESGPQDTDPTDRIRWCAVHGAESATETRPGVSAGRCTESDAQ
jgi:hypothetical protein